MRKIEDTRAPDLSDDDGELDLENECECRPCPKCAGYPSNNPCEHDDLCLCDEAQ